MRGLYQKSVVADFDRDCLINETESARTVEIKNKKGEFTDKYIYQLREDNGIYWLFIARTEKMGKTSMERASTVPESILITLKEEYSVQIYDTVSGTVKAARYKCGNDRTVIEHDMYANDSLLLRLSKEEAEIYPEKPNVSPYKKLTLEKALVSRCEENCVVFDMAKYSFDGEKYSHREYILEINSILFEKYDIKPTQAQPYIYNDELEYEVYLRFEFVSTEALSGLSFAMERLEEAKIYFNSSEVENETDGFYVDRSIRKVALPPAIKGKNVIELKLPFSVLRNLEPCYLLGEFDVEISENEITVKDTSDKEIYFNPIQENGMPFYSGNLIYKTQIHTQQCTAKIIADNFAAPCVRVTVDGKNSGLIAFSPFEFVTEISEGLHDIEFICYGNRNNTFGPIHNTKMTDPYYYVTPNSWDKHNGLWSESYCFQNTGILKGPVIELYN